MIQLYNENEFPVWEMKQTSDKYHRIQTRVEPFFGIDVYSENLDMSKFNLSNLDTINDFKEPVVFYSGNTSQSFESKRLYPYIKDGNGNYNSNIVIAAFDMTDGRRLINHYSRYAYLYAAHYDYAKKQLYMIFAFNTGNDPERKCYLENVFMSEDGKMAYMRHFYLNKGNIYVVAKQMDMENPIERGKKGYIVTTDLSINDGKDYAFKLFVPLKPTKNVFTFDSGNNETVINIYNERYNYTSDNVNIISISNENGDSTFRETAKNLAVESKVAAITYFVDRPREAVTDDQELANEILNKYCGKFFSHVMVLCNDGFVVKIR